MNVCFGISSCLKPFLQTTHFGDGTFQSPLPSALVSVLDLASQSQLFTLRLSIFAEEHSLSLPQCFLIHWYQRVLVCHTDAHPSSSSSSHAARTASATTVPTVLPGGQSLCPESLDKQFSKKFLKSPSSLVPPLLPLCYKQHITIPYYARIVDSLVFPWYSYYCKYSCLLFLLLSLNYGQSDTERPIW